MIARLPSDNELELPSSADVGASRSDSLNRASPGRRISWEHRGRSQVVFNGPHARATVPADANQQDAASN